ncbi:MAG: Mut7-C RNAse domain-containing protein [Actinomycetota bacterium]
MKFIADAMLGRLARYLRAAGYDVIYFKQTDDRKMIDTAASQNRIILTRDSLIQKSKPFKDRKPRLLLIESDNYMDQLRQVKHHLGLKLEASFSRCISCNARLKKISKKDYTESIPPFVYRTCNDFWRCTGCKKIYWQGSHCTSIRNTLSSVG